MRALFVMPHLDDETISCGALLKGLRDKGWETSVLTVYGRTYNHNSAPDPESDDQELTDWTEALKVLDVTGAKALLKKEGEPAQVGYYDILKPLEFHLMAIKPSIVVGPSELDRNQDHQFLAKLLDIALRPSNLGSVDMYLQFIALDGTLQKPNYFFGFGEDLLDTKLKALSCYRREQRFGSHPRSSENVRAQAMVWGASCGYDYAEAYHCKMARNLCELRSPEVRDSSART